jgi:hypothetical protein
MTEYKPLDFNKIKSVEFIDASDIHYQQWIQKRNTKQSINPAKIKRQQSREKYPILFQEIHDLWNSKEFRDEYEGTIQICNNCKNATADKYDHSQLVCWNGWISGRPKYITKYMNCNSWNHKRISQWNNNVVYEKVPYFYQFVCKRLQAEMCSSDTDNILNGGNIRAHLKDMNILDNTDDKKTGWQQAKNKEIHFLKNLNKKYLECGIPIEFIFLNTIFKIKHSTGFISFKELDAFLTFKNVYILIEYKVMNYDYNSNQVTDYMKLLKLTQTINEDQYKSLFVFCVCNGFYQYSNQYSATSKQIKPWPEINIVDEQNFDYWVRGYFYDRY